MAQHAGQVLAVIPVRGKDVEGDTGPVLLAGRPLIAYTIEAALASPTVDRTIVTTDSEGVQRLAVELGAEAPFLRPAELAASGVTLDRVLQHCVDWVAEHWSYAPEIVVTLEVAHPLRPQGLIEQVVAALREQHLETVFAALEERHAFWALDDYGELRRMGSQESPTRDTLAPVYREIAGLAIATRTDALRRSGRFGTKIGVVPLRDPTMAIDTQDTGGLLLAEIFVSEESRTRGN